MSDIVKNLYVLSSNPFIFAEPMHAFYSSLGAKPKGLLLSYLVLPLVLHPASQQFLEKANKTSSLRTLTNKPKDGLLWGLEQRIETWSAETNLTLRHLFDSEALVKSTALSVVPGADNDFGSVAPANSVRAASRLGLILQPHDVATIFCDLGIKQLSL